MARKGGGISRGELGFLTATYISQYGNKRLTSARLAELKRQSPDFAIIYDLMTEEDKWDLTVTVGLEQWYQDLVNKNV